MMSTSLVFEGEVIELPNELVENPSLIPEILTFSCWQNELNDSQRKMLEEFLPQSLSAEAKTETLRMLFGNKPLMALTECDSENFSANPVQDLVQKLEKDYFTPEMYSVRKNQKKMMKARAKLIKAKYYNKLLKEVVVSRQCHLAAFSHPKKLKLSYNNTQESSISSTHQEETKLKESNDKLYRSVLNDVKRKVLEQNPKLNESDLVSSDSDSTEKIEITSNNKVHNGVTSKRFREMLIQHKRRRDAGVKTPDLDTRGIKLSDVISRTFNGNKKLQGMLSKKKRQQDVTKLSKQNIFKKKKSISKRKKSDSMTTSSHNRYKKINSKPMPSCFFVLVKNVLELSSIKTTDSIAQLINDWLSSAEASRCIWTTTRNDWNQLVKSALEFMRNPTDNNGTEENGNNFQSVVELNELIWKWIGFNEKQNEQIGLNAMCQKWLAKQPMVKTETVLSRENYLKDFHAQEKRRFQYAHQSFVYTIDGNRYTVPPVKGSVGPTKEGKVAREHSLLNSDRPPQVTLLSLTRDAVARLPNRKGTRTDVCNLIRESQYLAAVVGEAQINSAVSGALDRLHYEHDPCVKFDASKRMWVNLHADRTVQELERIHAEQMESPRPKRVKSQTVKRKKNPEEKEKTKKKRTVKRKSKESKQDISGTDTLVETSNTTFSSNVDNKLTTAAGIISSTISFTNSPKKNFHSVNAGKIRPLSTTLNVPGTQTVIPPMVSTQSELTSLPGVPGKTRTIQLTQKQLLDMTRKLSNPTTPSTNREFLISHQNTPSASTEKPRDNRLAASLKLATPPVRPQPSLKLILKPAVGDQRRPTAELVRVVEPSKSTPQNVPRNLVTKQQVLTPDALRRLSEQLSAVSSRPIKIVQQTVDNKQKSTVVKNATGSRVITISNSSQSNPSNLIPQSRPSNVINLTMKGGFSGQNALKSAQTGKSLPTSIPVSEARISNSKNNSSKVVYLKRQDTLDTDHNISKNNSVNYSS